MTHALIRRFLAPPPVEHPTESSYRWVMLGLVWLIYLAHGLVSVAIAPLVTPITRDLSLSFTEMGLVLGAWQLVYVGFAPIAGVVIDRVGLRTTLGLGILVIALSAGLRMFATGFGPLFFAVALFGIGGPMLSIGAPKLVSVWFQGNQRGLAAGLYATGPIVGAIIGFTLINSVFVPLTGGWRQTFVALSAITLGTATIWWLLAKEGAAPDEQGVPQGNVARSSRLRQDFLTVIAERNVQLVLLLAIMTFIIGHGLSNWLPRLLEEGGMSPAQAGFWAALPSVTGIVGLLVIPRLVRYGYRSYALAFLFLMKAGAMMLLAQHSQLALMVGLATLGVVEAASWPIVILVLMETPSVGSRRMGLATGLYYSVAEIGGFGGPLLLGAIHDATGSLIAGVMLLSGLALLLILPALLIRERANAAV